MADREARAVLDRLTHRCHILEAIGESDRLRSARKRIKAKEEVSLTKDDLSNS